ncbi:unnamed protein product, partial [Pylaiella littoralis]
YPCDICGESRPLRPVRQSGSRGARCEVQGCIFTDVDTLSSVMIYRRRLPSRVSNVPTKRCLPLELIRQERRTNNHKGRRSGDHVTTPPTVVRQFQQPRAGGDEP